MGANFTWFQSYSVLFQDIKNSYLPCTTDIFRFRLARKMMSCKVQKYEYQLVTAALVRNLATGLAALMLKTFNLFKLFSEQKDGFFEKLVQQVQSQLRVKNLGLKCDLYDALMPKTLALSCFMIVISKKSRAVFV